MTVRATESSALAPGSIRSLEQAAAATLSALKTLVVDDDDATLMLIRRRLEKDGLQVLSASSGEEALGLVQGHAGEIGLILLDVMMPRLDGFEVLERLKVDPEALDIPVIMLTAHANEELDVVRGIQNGAEDHVQKPFRGAVLLAKVRAQLRRRAARLSMAERLQRAESLAATDPLTLLGNRRHFEKQLAVERAYARRHHHPFALLMMDLDHFKSINDTFGHPEGDRVLQYAATVTRETLRVSDQCFRVGGEEFGVLLRGSDGSAALLAAWRIVAAISKTNFRFADGRERRITVSVGVAAAEEAIAFQDEEIVERADRALYQAKARGRARAELAPLPQSLK